MAKVTRAEGCRRTSSGVVEAGYSNDAKSTKTYQANEVRCSELRQVDIKDCDKHSGVYWEKIRTERSPFRYDNNGDQRCYDIITTMQKRTYSCRAKRLQGLFRSACTADKRCTDEVEPEQVIMVLFLTLGEGGVGVRGSAFLG